jgi:uncharacterized membrane protein YeaQ/YmgE (transglycosylase-associated protein family)
LRAQAGALRTIAVCGSTANGKEIAMNPNTQALIVTAIVGIVAGWLASFIVRGPSSPLGYLLVGLIGAFVGNFVLNAVGWKPKLGNDLVDAIATSAIGAIIVIILARIILY